MSEIELLREDIKTIGSEFSVEIERFERTIISEINRAKFWILITVIAEGALFITLAKVFFDK